MYHHLASRLALDPSDSPSEVSPAVSMDGVNAAQIELTILRFAGTNVKIDIELSNDRENWRLLSGSTETFTAEGYDQGTLRTGIASGYILLKYQLTGTGTDRAILSVGVRLSNQN